MNDALAGWLRLTLVSGVGGQSQRRLLKAFGLPDKVFQATRGELQHTVSPDIAERLLTEDVSAQIDAALAWAAQPGNCLLTLADAHYPRQLLQTDDPPTLLYVKGRVELLNRSCIAVVGSRNCTPQGAADAQRFASALSQAGLTVVSGLALGIDAAAHRGALTAPGATIAVIGTGVDRLYPARNRDLALQIAKEGVIVSEFPMGTPALAANFPRRNRVISGLSLGVLLVEAAQRSGSLITARLAAEQGREVFAIPGSIHSPLSKGCHRLIKQGAKLVDDAQDILDELNLAPTHSVADDTLEEQRENELLSAMGFEPLDIDALAQRSGFSAQRLTAALLELELEGRVAPLPGGRFQRLN